MLKRNGNSTQSQRILCNAPSSIFVVCELIISSSNTDDKDEYLDFISTPNNEHKHWSWSGGIPTETETTQLDNAHLEPSVIQKKCSPRKKWCVKVLSIYLAFFCFNLYIWNFVTTIL